MKVTTQTREPLAHVRVATWNVSTLTGRIVSLIRHADELKLDVLCLQEVRVGSHSRVSMIKHAKNLGWNLMFHVERVAATTGALFGGMAVLARGYVQSLQTPPWMVGSSAVQLFRLHLPQRRPVTVANIHLSAACRVLRSKCLEQLTTYLAELGGSRLLIGDFNCIPTQAPVSHYLAAGCLHLTETWEEQQRPTRTIWHKGERLDGRHIDFGLHTMEFVPLARHQWHLSFSDHHLIAYDFATLPPEEVYRFPRRH